jgi:uncharacterized coiled-coil DUF342 family protein
MITKIHPDKQKAHSLQVMAEITLQRLAETNTAKYPSNTLIDYYDAIHKLLEALAVGNGIKTKGDGAHQELIDYAAKQYSFSEQIRQFLQQMRDYRNRISYEGFTVPTNYILLNESRIKQIIATLFELLGKK